MIVFNLKCSQGHGFEEWFASSADYQAKAAARALVCPECGSTYIEKGLSAPRINGGAQAPAPAAGPCGLPACASGVCQMANSLMSVVNDFGRSEAAERQDSRRP